MGNATLTKNKISTGDFWGLIVLTADRSCRFCQGWGAWFLGNRQNFEE